MGAGFFLLGGTKLSVIALVKLALYVAMPAALGVLIGSLPVYFIAYYGGEPAIRKWGKWFFLKWEDVERAKDKISRKRLTFWIITFFRFLPAMPSVVITAFAGAIRLSFWEFAISSLIGVFLRAFTMGAIGWLSNGLYRSFADRVSKVEEIVGISLIILAVLIWIWYVKRSKKNKAI